MFCSECGDRFESDMAYCARCGKAVKPARRTIVDWLITVFWIVGLALAGSLVVGIAKFHFDSPFPANRNTPPQQAYTTRREPIFNGNIAVGPETFHCFQFAAPALAIDPKVTGRFSATGGSGNDIRALILTPDHTTNWANTGTATTARRSRWRT